MRVTADDVVRLASDSAGKNVVVIWVFGNDCRNSLRLDKESEPLEVCDLGGNLLRSHPMPPANTVIAEDLLILGKKNGRDDKVKEAGPPTGDDPCWGAEGNQERADDDVGIQNHAHISCRCRVWSAPA